MKDEFFVAGAPAQIFIGKLSGPLSLGNALSLICNIPSDLTFDRIG
jgi:hypothetical protein